MRGEGDVIEEDSIFPCRHRGLAIAMVTWLQSCGLLSSFFMFSLFDVVSLGELLIQSWASALSRYSSPRRVSFYKFSLYSAGAERRMTGRGREEGDGQPRGAHSVHAKHIKLGRAPLACARQDTNGLIRTEVTRIGQFTRLRFLARSSNRSDGIDGDARRKRSVVCACATRSSYDGGINAVCRRDVPDNTRE